MSIAAAVLDALHAEAALHPGERPTRAGLRIGELSGVEPESLRFCLETLVTGTDLESLTFDLEISPWMRHCRHCNAPFRVIDYQVACPTCGSAETDAAGGDQMELSYLELEEAPDARAPGT
jgi:hydrogenase nickel incorporation protein HypA/HybF